MTSDESELWFVGEVLLSNVHPVSVCADGPCCLHNPSDHPLRDAPLRWRPGRRMERVCWHGIGHPDPDDLAHRRASGHPDTAAHACCGCCGID